jgi:plasmid stabilization system protein ParE
MIVVLSREAERDLETIGDYIARDNPARALSFVQELLARCGTLAVTPDAFPLVPRYERHGVRRLVHGRYLIFYRVADGQVQVLHILNGAQDVEAILFPDG